MVKNLVVTTLPNRQGWWLALVSGSHVRPLAKFRSGDAVDAFTSWIEETPGLRFEDRTGLSEGPVEAMKPMTTFIPREGS